MGKSEYRIMNSSTRNVYYTSTASEAPQRAQDSGAMSSTNSAFCIWSRAQCSLRRHGSASIKWSGGEAGRQLSLPFLDEAIEDDSWRNSDYGSIVYVVR